MQAEAGEFKGNGMEQGVEEVKTSRRDEGLE